MNKPDTDPAFKNRTGSESGARAYVKFGLAGACLTAVL